MLTIKVPATTANLGPGFDSCGLALSLYLYLTVKHPQDEWYIEHDLPNISHDMNNLIIATALKIAPQLQPHYLIMQTDIPTTRGLGSSSSAIVAGIELANQLENLNLTQDEKIMWASRIEGHPDNVAPAISGDFVAAMQNDKQTFTAQHRFPDCDIIVFIPQSELSTELSRSVLPKEITMQQGVQASAIANLLIAGITTNNLQLAGEMMRQDLWHEQYRLSLVPHLTDLRKISEQLGGYGSCLSGAGPTVITFAPKGHHQKFIQAFQDYDSQAQVMTLDIDRQGVCINFNKQEV